MAWLCIVVHLAGVQKLKVTKISKTNTRGSKRRKCQKDDATNTYPSRDLLDLRLMQVGVLIVKVKMVS